MDGNGAFGPRPGRRFGGRKDRDKQGRAWPAGRMDLRGTVKKKRASERVP